VYVDPGQIGLVLGNLVINAYQAMPEGGSLIISARAEEDEVALSVADIGCGISQEYMAKLFEPLFTTKARGIGLGLAISKNLVEVNGGSIEVESEVGRGSIFTIRLPLARPETETPAVEE
jgi:signal transduction histidine kinase